MLVNNPIRIGWLAALVASVGVVWCAEAQDYGGQSQNAKPFGGYRVAGQPQGQPAAQAPYQLAERLTTPAGPLRGVGPGLPNEHPLTPAIQWAREGLHNIEQVQDYSAVLVKREQVDGKLLDEQYMFVKIRHRPMSVYLYFLKPESLKGQEVIWVEGQNDGKMWAHGTGIKGMFGTVSLSPTGALAMEGNRYPITEIGILNLVRRLLEVAQRDAQYAECEVQFFPGAKINDRVCTCIQVTHPVPRQNFLYHVARIFIDDELNVPIRYEAYDWPTQPGQAPPLAEQYTYLNLKLNNGFTDADFDIRNPQYGFKSLGLSRN